MLIQPPPRVRPRFLSRPLRTSGTDITHKKCSMGFNETRGCLLNVPSNEYFMKQTRTKHVPYCALCEFQWTPGEQRGTTFQVYFAARYEVSCGALHNKQEQLRTKILEASWHCLDHKALTSITETRTHGSRIPFRPIVRSFTPCYA